MLASGQAAAECAAALGRREGALGGGAADGDFQISAKSILCDGRGGRAAGRIEHRTADEAAERDVHTDAVCNDHAFEANYGGGGVTLWRDDAGTGSVKVGVGEIW